MSQKPHAQVGVFVMRSRFVTQFMMIQKIIEFRGGIIGVRILGIGGIEVVGEPRQSRRVGGQVQQRDFMALKRRDVDPFRRQVDLEGIGEFHFPLEDPVGQQRDGEDFGDGTDLIDRAAVRSLCPISIDATVSAHLGFAIPINPHGDAHRGMPIDEGRKNRIHVSGRE